MSLLAGVPVAVVDVVDEVVSLRRKLLHPLLMMKPSLAPPLTSEVPMLVASWAAEVNSD